MTTPELVSVIISCIALSVSLLTWARRNNYDAVVRRLVIDVETLQQEQAATSLRSMLGSVLSRRRGQA